MRALHCFRVCFFLASCVALAAMQACTTESTTGKPRCFLTGVMVPRPENKDPPSLTDMLRLHFDVSSPEDKGKCEQMMESYCVHNVKGKSYSPIRLKGSFKPDIDKSQDFTYRFSENCRLEAE